MENYVIGVDIGGTHIRIGAQSNNGELIGFLKIDRTSVFNGTGAAESLSNFLKDYRKNILGESKLDAIAIGFPSAISADRQTILQTPNIEGLNNIPIVEILMRDLDVDVFIERDVNMLFQWDITQFPVPEDGIGVGIYVGTGIGNAIFIGGKPLIGLDGVAGEIGHIPVIGGKCRCSCGNIACAENYASGKRLVELGENYFENTEISDLFHMHGDSKVLREFTDAIACVVATEINILNPDYIVIGGGVVHMQDFPQDLLMENINKHVRKPLPCENLNLYFSNDSVKSGVLGAILYAKTKLAGKKR